jgi:NAD(P)H-binding
VGKPIAEELLKTGLHVVTAITRAGSDSQLPDGIKVVTVNYDDEQSLISALKGQQFLIITMSVFAPRDNHHKLVTAAAKAGTPYVMPNSYGYDINNIILSKEALSGDAVRAGISDIENQGVSSWVAMVCGFWYEWSLAIGPDMFGFDFSNKKVTFFDDGTTCINTTTLRQCGRAVAALLSLKELPEDENDKSATVSRWKNKPLYVSSFLVSQRDMLDSVNRVMGTTDKDWTIDKEPTEVRYKNGLVTMQTGNRLGFARAMYSRVFWPNGDGNYESSRGLDNDVLGLPKDDLDDATKIAVDMVQGGWIAAMKARHGLNSSRS